MRFGSVVWAVHCGAEEAWVGCWGVDTGTGRGLLRDARVCGGAGAAGTVRN